MKNILSVLFLFLFHTPFAQLTTNVEWTDETSLPAAETIYYDPGEKLVWHDFTGKPDFTGNVAALTMSGFGYNADISYSGNTGKLNLKVYCYFNKNRSWVKPGKTTDYILNHEQHHFDVTFIAASIFAAKLQHAVFTKDNYNVLLQQLYDQSVDLMNKMQNDYDSQTSNGRLPEMQAAWNEIIDKKLAGITK